MQRLQPFLHHVVVVVAACITSDGASRLASAVVHGHHDRAHGTRMRAPGVVSEFGVARHVLHVGVAPVRDPVVEVRGGLCRPEADEAHEVEA
ncbi:MAG: hypothetical protein IPF87_23480 [Gemmatimonadetes bacterium]|nr:hypothetical protein [Gemmatimonadota bacterium]MBK6844801.1 hypothetical protein [Gemmatimonadota bacterium]